MPATAPPKPTVGQPFNDPREGWTVKVRSGRTLSIIEHKRFPSEEDAHAFADMGGHTPRSGKRSVMTLVADGRDGYTEGAR